MSIQINISENGTTTLHTAGYYCDRNIDVNVEVSGDITNDADELAQGTISGAYVSDKVTSLRKYAFAYCANLTSVSLPNCTSVDEFSFLDCTNAESIDLPMCISINGVSAFESAKKLKTINLPNLTTMTTANRIFLYCESLEEFYAPNLISMNDTNRLFGSCSKLKKVTFPKLGGTTINAYTFYKCTNLETLILGGDTLNPLENVNAFNKITNIYVKDNLVDTYKTATNWSNFADKIKSIEKDLEE
jgi:hypothetical protein